MANRLFELFDDAARVGKSVASSPPRNLSEMTVSGSSGTDALQTQVDISKIVRYRVDYSDFSNFVYFNSALDYFNISAERMLNEYPYDGTYNDQLVFRSQSDGYQNYLLDNWPLTSGCARFSGSSFVLVPDPLSKTSIFGSSYTIEARFSWDDLLNIPANNSRCIFSAVDASGNVSLALHFVNDVADVGNELKISVYNGSVEQTGSITQGSNYVAVACDITGTQRVYSAVLSSSVVLTDEIAAVSASRAPVSMTLGSGTVGPPAFPSQSLSSLRMREIRVWNSAKTLDDIQANYNVRVFKEDNLLYYARLNEGTRSVARDYSGNKLHGLFAAAAWSADSLGFSPQDENDFVMEWRDARLSDFITAIQATAATYDRNNSNIITTLVPEQFLILEEERQTTILRNLLYLLGRQFDELKVAIEQFPRSLLSTYTGFDDAPDALLNDTLKFWGWDAPGSFLSKEAFQYFFGYNVIQGEQADYDNQRLDTTLEQIKSQFWRRTLQNLPHIYKTKGTRESVESLLRVYGLDEKVVKLKEFGLKPLVQIQTNRINSERSTTAIRISGTFTVDAPDQSIGGYADTWTQNMWVKFPANTDMDMPPTLTTGSISHLYQVGGAGQALPVLMAFPLGGPVTSSELKIEEFRYSRDLSSTTGSFHWVSFDGDTFVTSGSWQNVPVFDGGWYHLMVHRSLTDGTSSTNLHIMRLDEDQAISVYEQDLSGNMSPAVAPGGFAFSVGRHFITGTVFEPTSGSQFWVRNVQFWTLAQSENEMLDHTLNPLSYGTDTPERESYLKLNWQFDYDKDSSIEGALDSRYKNGSPAVTGVFYIDDTPVPFASASYRKDVIEYNYIAPPEYGWNEDRIRTLPGTEVPVSEQWSDNTSLSLEFNLTDALNEDISFMLSSLDNWNNIIGSPANRYRESYPDLDRLRRQYFARLTGRINFRAFADFLDFFDRSFIELIAKLLPAEATFKGGEFVVESHMLERPKVQYTYRRYNPQLVPEGRILIYGHPALNLLTGSLPGPVCNGFTYTFNFPFCR